MTLSGEPFDCVSMKHKAQQRLRAEYESRKAEFSSYFAFLDAKANESKWQREFWQKVQSAKEGKQ